MRTLVLILMILGLVACAASVRYAPRITGVRPGYVDTRLGEDTYQVKIGEAWPKVWQDLEKFAMYRAAELTQQSGKRYFAVLAASSRVSHYAMPLPSTSQTTGTVGVFGNTAYVNSTTTTTGGGNLNISGGWYTLDFKVLDGSAAGTRRDIVDSEEVKKNLKLFIDSRR